MFLQEAKPILSTAYTQSFLIWHYFSFIYSFILGGGGGPAWNCPCSRKKKKKHPSMLVVSSHAPRNIYSQRCGFTLSGTNTTNTPRLSSHSPLPPRQQNTILFSPSSFLFFFFFHAAFWSARVPWRSRLGRERELSAYLFVAVSSPVRIKRATRSQSENIISL